MEGYVARGTAWWPPVYWLVMVVIPLTAVGGRSAGGPVVLTGRAAAGAFAAGECWDQLGGGSVGEMCD